MDGAITSLLTLVSIAFIVVFLQVDPVGTSLLSNYEAQLLSLSAKLHNSSINIFLCTENNSEDFICISASFNWPFQSPGVAFMRVN